MNAEGLWQAFLETGAPELYLLYAMMRKEEETHVFTGSRVGTESNQL